MNLTGETKTHHKTGSCRRLQQAVDYVGRQWFPVSPEVVNNVQKKLNAGEYSGDHQALILDLKSDLAFFSYCLKKIKEKSLCEASNPIAAFFGTEFDSLKEILLSPSQEISKHNFSGAEPSQSLRLKYTVLSCSAADLLACAKNANNDLAFTCALLRQLGLNLIAWNYPTIYGRALIMVKSAQATLEQLLADNLGFDPCVLAEELILSPDTNPYVRKAVGLTNIQAPSEGKHGDPGLVDICEISEAFAQLNDPEHYPNISRSYTTVIAQIDQYLGDGGNNAIMQLVNTKFASYVAQTPQIFKNENAFENAMAKVGADYTNKLFEQNAFAQRCSDQIKKELRAVYRHITRGQVSAMGIGNLVNRVIPSAGFTQGCVYLLDAKTNILVPKLRIGPRGLDRYRALNCTHISPNDNIIVEALYKQMPIKQAGIVIHGELASPILAPIGSQQPVGVLYLEMSDARLEKPDQETLTIFKAIRVCLNDCLNL